MNKRSGTYVVRRSKGNVSQRKNQVYITMRVIPTYAAQERATTNEVNRTMVSKVGIKSKDFGGTYAIRRNSNQYDKKDII